VINCQFDAPYPVYLQPAPVATEDAEVHPRRVKETLDHQDLFDDSVGGPHEQQAKPALAPADLELADEDSPAAVEDRQNPETCRMEELRRWRRAREQFGNDGS